MSKLVLVIKILVAEQKVKFYEISEQYPKAVQKAVDEALKEAFHGK